MVDTPSHKRAANDVRSSVLAGMLSYVSNLKVERLNSEHCLRVDRTQHRRRIRPHDLLFSTCKLSFRHSVQPEDRL